MIEIMTTEESAVFDYGNPQAVFDRVTAFMIERGRCSVPYKLSRCGLAPDTHTAIHDGEGCACPVGVLTPSLEGNDPLANLSEVSFAYFEKMTFASSCALFALVQVHELVSNSTRWPEILARIAARLGLELPNHLLPLRPYYDNPEQTLGFTCSERIEFIVDGGGLNLH